MNKTELGKKIQTLRKAFGITRQEDFGAKAGVSVRVIKEIEAGSGNTTIDNLELVLTVLKIDFNRHMLDMVPDPTTKKTPEIVENPAPLESIQKDLQDIKAKLDQKAAAPAAPPERQELIDLILRLTPAEFDRLQAEAIKITTDALIETPTNKSKSRL